MPRGRKAFLAHTTVRLFTHPRRSRAETPDNAFYAAIFHQLCVPGRKDASVVPTKSSSSEERRRTNQAANHHSHANVILSDAIIASIRPPRELSRFFCDIPRNGWQDTPSGFELESKKINKSMKKSARAKRREKGRSP